MSRAFTAGFVVLLLGASPALAGSYKYRSLTFPNASMTTATAISDEGQVVGLLYGGYKSFAWSHDVFTVVDGSSDSMETVLVGVSPKGLAVGWYVSSASGLTPFTYDVATGVRTTLAGEPNAALYAYAINVNGTAVGGLVKAGNRQQGFEASATHFRPLYGPAPHGIMRATGINRSGTVVGIYNDKNGTHTFTFKSGKYTIVDAPGSSATYTNFINDDGTMGGVYYISTVAHGFVKNGSQFTTVDFPGASSTNVLGVTKDGRVVGDWYADGANNGGFVLQGGKYIDITVPGGFNTVMTGTNSKGQMVGYYQTGNGKQRSFIAECQVDQRPCTQ